MNYIAQIKGFWIAQREHVLNATDIALYFYLLEVCNSSNWANPFKRNTAKVMADLKISRSSFDRSRNRLARQGICSYRSVNGTPNTTYQLTDLEALYRNRFSKADKGTEAGADQGCDTGADQLNKNSKQKPKQTAVVVSYSDAFDFFADTRNKRLLQEKLNLDNSNIESFFKTFYDSKIDLGDLNNKTLPEIARNFYYWLPKHLAALHPEKEKSCAKKESSTAKQAPVRGVAAALKFAGVKMREEE
jgi:hypothetical protein